MRLALGNACPTSGEANVYPRQSMESIAHRFMFWVRLYYVVHCDTVWSVYMAAAEELFLFMERVLGNYTKRLNDTAWCWFEKKERQKQVYMACFVTLPGVWEAWPSRSQDLGLAENALREYPSMLRNRSGISDFVVLLFILVIRQPFVGNV